MSHEEFCVASGLNDFEAFCCVASVGYLAAVNKLLEVVVDPAQKQAIRLF